MIRTYMKNINIYIYILQRVRIIYIAKKTEKEKAKMDGKIKNKGNRSLM